MKKVFGKGLSGISRRGLCILLSLLLILAQLPPVSASTLSEKELSLIMGAGMSQDVVQTPEAQAKEDQPPAEDTTPPAADSVTAEAVMPADVVQTASAAESVTAEAGVPQDVVQTPEVPAKDEQPPAEDVLPSEPSAPLSSDEAQAAVEATKPNADGMVLQSNAYSCGPAALATLLKIRSGKNYYEQIMQKVTLDEQGSSLLALRQAAEALGYQAQGYRLALTDLTGSEPLLAHVILNGQQHFTVFLKVYGQSAYLADPTLGRIAMSLEDFAQAFSGAVLKVGAAETAPPQADAAPQTEAASEAIATASSGEEVVPETKAPDAAAAPSAQAAPAPEPVVAETPAEQNSAPATQVTIQLAEETAGDTAAFGEEATPCPATIAEAAADPNTETAAAEAPAVEQNSAVEDKTTLQPALEPNADAAAVDVEHTANNEPPANQSVQLDAAEMEQIRGRLAFVAGAVTVSPFQFEISLNDPRNRIVLNEHFHRRLHTKEYFEHVENVLKKATSREEALERLLTLQKELQRAWQLRQR